MTRVLPIKRKKAIDPDSGKVVAFSPELVGNNYKLKRPPSDEKGQNALGEELVDWSMSAPRIAMQEFAELKCMSFYRIKKLREKNEYFKECYDFACDVICNKLRRDWYNDPQMRPFAERFGAMYSQEWRDAKKEDRHEESKSNEGTKYIYLDKIESSSQVPERIKNDVS